MILEFLKDTKSPKGGKNYKAGIKGEFSGLLREWCLKQIEKGNAKQVDSNLSGFFEVARKEGIKQVKEKNIKK